MLMIEETYLLYHAYRRHVDEFEECLAKFDAEGGLNLNALNDVTWRGALVYEDGLRDGHSSPGTGPQRSCTWRERS